MQRGTAGRARSPSYPISHPLRTVPRTLHWQWGDPILLIISDGTVTRLHLPLQTLRRPVASLSDRFPPRLRWERQFLSSHSSFSPLSLCKDTFSFEVHRRSSFPPAVSASGLLTGSLDRSGCSAVLMTLVKLALAHSRPCSSFLCPRACVCLCVRQCVRARFGINVRPLCGLFW